MKESPDRVVLLTASAVLVEQIIRCDRSWVKSRSTCWVPGPGTAKFEVELRKSIFKQLRPELAIEEGGRCHVGRVAAAACGSGEPGSDPPHLPAVAGRTGPLFRPSISRSRTGGSRIRALRLSLEDMIAKREVNRIVEYLEHTRQGGAGRCQGAGACWPGSAAAYPGRAAGPEKTGCRSPLGRAQASPGGDRWRAEARGSDCHGRRDDNGAGATP